VLCGRGEPDAEDDESDDEHRGEREDHRVDVPAVFTQPFL
jgi:hypothetical protein